MFEYDAAGGDLKITAGPRGDQLVATLHRMVAAAADTGWDVVVDHVLLDPRWVTDLAAVLGGYPLLAVGVRCRLDELERRERQRRDRTIGQARAHFDTVHAHIDYDIVVDTSAADPDACAAAVVDAISRHHGPGALRPPA